MRASKIGLLILILAFGGAIETAWTVRNRFDLGAAGCRLFGGKFRGPSYSFDVDERHDLPEGGSVEIQNAFGDVTLSVGVPGEVKLSLRKVVFLPTEEEARSFASELRVEIAREATAFKLGTNRNDLEDRARARDVGFETHFTVQVPPGTAVVVKNQHGRVDVVDVARAEVTNSYDPVRVEKVAGPVDITNRHGEVHASEIKGPLSLSSRFGDVEVRDVDGPVKLEVQHGGVSATRVGNLSAEMSHGDFKAEDIRGDFTFDGEHAAVEALGVTGSATVKTSYRNVQIERVKGDSRIKAAHGEVDATDLGGSLVVESSYDGVSLTRIAGFVEIKLSHGRVEARSLAEGARITSSGDEVVLDGFRGPVEIKAERGSVRLTPESALVDSLNVTTSSGDIQLEVPQGSRFDLDAIAARGEVQASGVPGLTLTQQEPAHAAGRLGSGGVSVQLRTQRGDINLSARSVAASKDPDSKEE